MSIQPQTRLVPSLEAHSSQRRSCDQLGLCQNRKPPCPGCTWRDTALFDKGVHHFAPGVIDAGPAKRPLLRRWQFAKWCKLMGGCIFAVAVVGSCSYVGYLSVMVGGSL